MRLLVLALLLATLPSLARGALPPAARIEGVPHVVQKPDLCGEACVSMGLAVHGVEVSQEEVFARSGLAQDAGRGCWAPDLYRALWALGVDTPSPWIALPDDAAGADRVADETWKGIQAEIAAGRPVIVCMHYDESPNTTEHFRLLVGYDEGTGEVIFHDPARAGGSYQRMSFVTFSKLWPLPSSTGGRYLVRFQMPAPRPAAPTSGPHAERARAMEAALGKDYLVAIEPPFVVAGNLDPGTFEEHRRLIRWAHRRYADQFFTRALDPGPIAVYLFRDDATYHDQTVKLFGEEPTTPFGFFTSAHDALVMNISTGNGTLLHEMIHPLMEVDFPAAPAWLNEGLGSLFERCEEREGKIVGRLNWRLPGLQDAVRAGSHFPLARLIATTRSEFYAGDVGLHYAGARYLGYWLQEQGKLEDFYRRFRDAASGDPTGLATLTALFPGKDLAALERDWVAFVGGLDASQAR